MRNEKSEVKSTTVNADGSYTTDSFRKIKDDDGTVRVARMEEKRPISVSLQTQDGRVFHNGARIA